MLGAIFGATRGGGMAMRAARSPVAPAHFAAPDAADFDDDDAPTPRPPQAQAKARHFVRQTGGRAYLASGEPGRPATAREILVVVPAGRHAPADGAVLFDSDRDAGQTRVPSAGRLTSVSVAPGDPTVRADAVGPDLMLLVFVGDPTTPRARVRLADVLRAGRRPLNLRRDAGQVVRLVVEDPAGVWRAGVPALRITLGWAD
jgi:Ca-activated chloride channel family protein